MASDNIEETKYGGKLAVPAVEGLEEANQGTGVNDMLAYDAKYKKMWSIVSFSTAS